MDVIEELDQRLKSQRRVVLSGIGGIRYVLIAIRRRLARIYIGFAHRKSQIAIEYCYRFRDRHPGVGIFWVHVGTISRFKQVYESIADDLDLIRKNDPKVNMLQFVIDWLNDEDNGNLLMILDSADD